MDFGKYDDYSHDNNPFAGSNHFYSNGILNAAEDSNDKDYPNSGKVNNGHTSHVVMTKGILETSSPNRTDIPGSMHSLSRSGLLGGSGLFGDDFSSDINHNDHHTPPHINNFNNVHHDYNDAGNGVDHDDHNETEEDLHDQVGLIRDHHSGEDEDEDDEAHQHDNSHSHGDESEDYDFTQISISEQPTLYVNPADVEAEEYDEATEADLSFHVTNSKMKVTGSTKNFMTVYYEIEYFGSIVHRRYSDFVSFRTYLLKFFQTKIIPPIPEKHSFSRVITNPLNYKQDSEIIDRRIRLLEYFLDRLYCDPEIRKSLVFNKFLDPSEKRWSQTLNNPPFTTLASRSLLLTSPKDPIKPNPYIVYLPIPPIGHLKKFNSKLNSTVFEPMEKRLKELLLHIKNLESIVKKLLHNLEKDRVSMVELGGFFNIFSILEEQQHGKSLKGFSYDYPEETINNNLSNNTGYIEKFGDKVDWSFLKIQELITHLTIRVKEPLIILKQTISAMVQLLAYRKLKELQMNCLQDIILRKQVKLKNIIEKLTSDIKLNEVLNNSHVDSPSVNNALKTVKAKRSKYGDLTDSSVIIIDDTPPSPTPTRGNIPSAETTVLESSADTMESRSPLMDSSVASSSDQTWKKAIAGSSSDSNINTPSRRKKGHMRAVSGKGNDLTKYSTSELNFELNKLNQELNTKLIPCFHSLLEDVKYLSINVEKNINSHYIKVIKSLSFIMSEWKSQVFVEFFESCTQIWTQEEESG